MAPPLYSQYPGDAATKRDVNGALQEAQETRLILKENFPHITKSKYYSVTRLF